MRYAVPVIIILILASWFFYSRQVVSTPLIPTNSQQSTSPTQSSGIQSNTLSKGQAPKINFKLPPGYVAHIFAQNLGTARDLQFSPGGVLLVSNPSAGQIVAMPDKDNDGVADEKKIIVTDGHHLHGIAFQNNKLYAAEVDQVMSYSWDENTLSVSNGQKLFSLPQNSDHNARTITFGPDGKMYVSVGSTCNVCNESSELSATVITANADGSNMHVFAKGLRNAPFIQFNPKTQELWGTEMGRDNLGDDIPPDEMNIIKDGKNYGWPICYSDRIHDTNFDHNQYIQDPCKDTQAPIFHIPAHSAPLGWTFINSPQFPADWQGDILVSYHGSWNRSIPIGYKVVHLKVSGNSITNSEDFLTGFLPSGALVGPVQAEGRPVDLTFDKNGNLYLSDDKSGSVYIIQKQ